MSAEAYFASILTQQSRPYDHSGTCVTNNDGDSPYTEVLKINYYRGATTRQLVLRQLGLQTGFAAGLDLPYLQFNLERVNGCLCQIH